MNQTLTMAKLLALLAGLLAIFAIVGFGSGLPLLAIAIILLVVAFVID